MGRRRSDENHTLKKFKIQREMKKMEYSVPDPNKTMINDTKEPNNTHKNSLKEEILQEISENFMEKILHMVNKNVQDALKKFQYTKK
jgi:hypothetical protein